MKYRGPLEQKYNSRIYVGVRLDEPGKANTRGIHPDITIVKSSMFYLPFLLKLMQELQKLVKVYEKQIFLVYFFYTENPKDLSDGKTFLIQRFMLLRSCHLNSNSLMNV